MLIIINGVNSSQLLILCGKLRAINSLKRCSLGHSEDKLFNLYLLMSEVTLYIPWEDNVFGKGEIRIKPGNNTKNTGIKTYRDSYTQKFIKENLEMLKVYFKGF